MHQPLGIEPNKRGLDGAPNLKRTPCRGIADPVTSQQIAITLFLQLTVILAATRVVSALARYLGQPGVVGEMIAGILLGPSLFGALAPEWQAVVFPKESIPILFALSQLGLVLYMFIIGTEFDVALLSSRKRSAVSVSLAGIIAPFALGALLAASLSGSTELFSPTVTAPQAMLFTGAAMCITAFPMLARIISERGLAGTSIGTLALAAGAFDDVVAWCLLAFVVGSFGGNGSLALLAVGGGLAYAILLLLVVRPVLHRVAQHRAPSSAWMFFIMTLLMLSAWYTDYVGIYAVFGAFLLGAVIPRGAWTNRLDSELRPLTTSLLLPIFFIYSGLNTRIDLVVAPSLWVTTLAVIAIAVVGKGAACAIVARLSGEGWRAACAIGALMNARGLMELILLNIGLSHGIITPAFFSIMVVMAVVTTLMATPLFQLALFQSTLSCAEVAGTPLRDRHEPGAPQERIVANG